MNLTEYLKAVEPNPLYEEIYELACFASNAYENLRHNSGLSNNDGEHWDIDSIASYDIDGITTNWEYSWGFGGHDEGNCFIPINAIIGSENDRIAFIKGVVHREVNLKNNDNASDEIIEKDKRFAEYEKLKLEFES